MAWYPSGSGEPPAGDDEQTNERTAPTAVTPPVRDDDPTLARQPDASDDDPTSARLSSGPRPGAGRTVPDVDTFNDNDPTVNRRALSKTEPAAELLDHRYQLLGQIGAGGMGEVWRARHVKLARDVAIKFLTNEEGGPRFELEAQAIAAIRHTGVVDVLDFGETSKGVPYFVMELIEGETLMTRVRRQGPLSWALVRNIALEVSDALAHAHEVGVVHRDLKPSNVIVLESPPPRGSSTKLIDFGIARRLDTGKPRLTKTGFIQGTPAYMSPEQVLGEDVDARADVYGLGCLMYFLISGRRPFPDKSGTATLRAQLYEEPPRFAELVPGHPIPSDVESVVRRAIAKDVSARFQSMRELHEAIFSIPPDAGASVSVPVVARDLVASDSSSKASKSSASDALRTTASYSASYEALNELDASASKTGASASSSALGGSQAPNPGPGPAPTPSFPTAPVDPSPETSLGDKLEIGAAITVSVVLVVLALLGLYWALTS